MRGKVKTDILQGRVKRRLRFNVTRARFNGDLSDRFSTEGGVSKMVVCQNYNIRNAVGQILG